MENASKKPLAGIRVVEMARILAGPWAGQTLADLGADVIKIESPDGDDTRKWGPPFLTRDEDVSASYYFAANRGKRSITLDFKDPEDRAVLDALLAHADIFIENFKQGGLAKHGLDYETLHAKHPGLIYCSITGFGQTGPYAPRPGYDYIIQGMSGIMSVTGEEDGEPLRCGIAFTDIFTGVYSVVGILAALRQRDATGLGQQLDMALLDTATSVTANQAQSYLMTGENPRRTGNWHPSVVPYQVFEVMDGHIIITAGNDQQFQRLCNVLGLSDMGTDPKFATNATRIENRPEMAGRLQQALLTWPKDKILAALEAASIGCGQINNMDGVFADPQVQAREMQIAPEGVPGIRTPLRFSDAELALDRAPPKLGEHSAEIRAELGFGKKP